MKVNYADTLKYADDISNAASEFISNVNSYFDIVDDLVSNWQGIDNVNYANNVKEFKPDLVTLGEVVDDYGKFIKGAANTIQNLQDDIAGQAGRL